MNERKKKYEHSDRLGFEQFLALISSRRVQTARLSAHRLKECQVSNKAHNVSAVTSYSRGPATNNLFLMVFILVFYEALKDKLITHRHIHSDFLFST